MPMKKLSGMNQVSSHQDYSFHATHFNYRICVYELLDLLAMLCVVMNYDNFYGDHTGAKSNVLIFYN